MRRRGTGTIVGMASVAGYRGFPRSEAYGATKAAEINMLEALRIDLRPLGITVQTVCPGFVRTDLTAKNTFPMPFMLEADDAARRICRGIEKEKAEIVFPFPMMLGDEGAAARPGAALHGRVRGGAPAGAADVTERPPASRGSTGRRGCVRRKPRPPSVSASSSGVLVHRSPTRRVDARLGRMRRCPR